MTAEKDSDGNDITGTENTAAEAIADSPTYTLSQQTPSNSYDIGFTWNALDFGLSYVRAGQQANKYLISKELEQQIILLAVITATFSPILFRLVRTKAK